MNNESLISELTHDGYLKTPTVIEAFRAVDRGLFVPEDRRAEAYGNYPLPLGHGQTISQPLSVAFMLEQLEVKPGDHILEIGSGSGWQTALLSYLVGAGGRVVSIERVSELAALAARNVAASLPEAANIKLVVGDGTQGFAEGAPYDCIVAGASAAARIPSEWKEQVKIGGRVVAPVADSIIVFTKTAHDSFVKRQYLGFSFVPLVADPQKHQ
jgi:protein-L-isoaspartate(D-aspartate) O-methyltransferase